MSRPRGRSPSRRPVLSRAGELLASHMVIWLIGLGVGVTFLVGMSTLGPTRALLLALALVVFAATAFVLKDRVMILRWRILVTGQRLSRRQFLATTVSIFIAAAVSALFGWMLGTFILDSYEEQVRSHLTPKRSK